MLDKKKGIVYQFLLKIIHSIYQSSDTKIYKLQEQAPGDIEKERVTLGLDEFNTLFTLEVYSKIAFI